MRTPKRAIRTLVVTAVVTGALMPLPTRAATGVPIRGTVTSSGPVGAATVTLWVEPDQEFQAAALEQGQPISMREMETVPAGADGSYRLVLDRTALGPDFVAADGHVQAWVAASLNGRTAS